MDDVPVHIDPRIAEELHALAGNEENASMLLTQAAEHLIEELKVQRGVADAAAGRLIPHEEVESWVNSWGEGSTMAKPET